MNWLGALLVAVALVALAVGVGVAGRALGGRVRHVRRERGRETVAGPRAGASAATADVLGISHRELGRRATLVQLSTEFCSRCPSAARQLASIADEYDGVRHVEVDITNRADLADRFRVLQTPTTLILGADGTSAARIGGVPRGHEVRDLLDRLTRSHRVTR